MKEISRRGLFGAAAGALAIAAEGKMAKAQSVCDVVGQGGHVDQVTLPDGTQLSDITCGINDSNNVSSETSVTQPNTQAQAEVNQNGWEAFKESKTVSSRPQVNLGNGENVGREFSNLIIGTDGNENPIFIPWEIGLANGNPDTQKIEHTGKVPGSEFWLTGQPGKPMIIAFEHSGAINPDTGEIDTNARWDNNDYDGGGTGHRPDLDLDITIEGLQGTFSVLDAKTGQPLTDADGNELTDINSDGNDMAFIIAGAVIDQDQTYALEINDEDSNVFFRIGAHTHETPAGNTADLTGQAFDDAEPWN